MPIIEARQLSKTFQARGSQVQAVSDVSFEVQRGEFLSILGPSGCGKTTILRMMAGLEFPSSGAILLEGRPIQGPQRGVGIVFQVPALMNWRTALTNVTLLAEILRLPDEESRTKAHELLDLVGLADFANKYPHELSGGMQQRVAIARALVHDPEILLLDEPFSALDAMTRNQLNVELLRIWEESRKTSVLITHSIPEAVFLSDRVLVLTQRPARILEIVKVDLPRKRSPSMRVSSEFVHIVDRIGRLIGLEYA